MGRKIIFSRKGFDSTNGGHGERVCGGRGRWLVSPFPTIPAIGEGHDTDVVDYDNLSVPVDCDNPSGGKMSLRERIRMLKSEKFASKFGILPPRPGFAARDFRAKRNRAKRICAGMSERATCFSSSAGFVKKRSVGRRLASLPRTPVGMCRRFSDFCK